MQIYFIESKGVIHTQYWRTCAYHSSIFHGIASQPETLDQMLLPPSLTNQNREPYRIRRSGRFVPRIWMASSSLIVADSVKQQLARLLNMDFLPVIFERLVDVPMPALGDFSWYERITYPPEPEPDYELKTSPDVPAFHQTIGRFWEVLSANLYELDSRPNDAKPVEVDFGSYAVKPNENVLVSLSLLQKYPVVWSGITQVREDVFAIIAPFLDIDYFNIARHYIETEEDLKIDDETADDDEE